MDINKFKLFQRKKFEDERGLLSEGFKISEFGEFNENKVTFVQDNFVVSNKNVIRGLHYQAKPRSQAKYISVLLGEIFDVIVDIRMNSETFGKCFCEAQRPPTVQAGKPGGIFVNLGRRKEPKKTKPKKLSLPQMSIY